MSKKTATDNRIETFQGVPPMETPEFDDWLKQQHRRLNPSFDYEAEPEQAIKITAAGKKALGR